MLHLASDCLENSKTADVYFCASRVKLTLPDIFGASACGHIIINEVLVSHSGGPEEGADGGVGDVGGGGESRACSPAEPPQELPNGSTCTHQQHNSIRLRAAVCQEPC